MPSYTPPLRDLQFVLHDVLRAGDVYRSLPPHAEIDAPTIDAILEEGGKFASEVVAPLNRGGDEEGCRLVPATNEVHTPAGFREAYARFVEGGWPALSCDPEYGGQGLPVAISQCLFEMLNSANQAWTMYPGLTHGAYECLHAHGTAEQRRTYLPKLTSGEWTGTMCLTEAHCGTDLGLLRSRAEPAADGSWRITGNKIFISSGEHDMAANIVHLVLARLPGAPAGSKGITLFVVPKFLVEADGSPGERNGVRCIGLEHKMGIHGNATCQLALDGAAGWLVGEANKGLAAMFVMMNAARLGVGLQGLGLTEVAYQNAAAYARDRLQMRSLSGAKAPGQPADPIIVHPDVRRMLLTARAYAEGGRALALHIALLIDQELHHPEPAVRADCAGEVALLTPIVKAFLTDNAWIATSNCMQVLGGHGYVRESGLEQFVRDARINMIYEGTNGIQALDLLGRKVLGDGGARLKAFGRRIAAFVEAEAANEAMQPFVGPLAELGKQLPKLTTEIGMKAMLDPDEVGAASVDYLRLCGHLVFAWLWARMAEVALAQLQQSGADSRFCEAKLATARFYFAQLLPETASLIARIRAGGESLMAMDAAMF